MKGIDYIVCAAGLGTRTQQIAPIAKPLIQLNGSCLMEWSLRSLDLFPQDRLIIITLKEHGLRPKLEDKVKALYPFLPLIWIELNELTSGQLATGLAARSYFEADRSLAFFNSDTFFRSSKFRALVSDPEIEGIVPCSQEPGEAWSFCLTEKDSLTVAKVTEKERISDWASVGLYYFRDSMYFLDIAEQALNSDNKTANEDYIAPLYNRLIADNKQTVVDSVDVFLPMGSLEQIESYWKVSLSELRQQNRKRTLVIDLDNTITIEEPNTPYSEKRPNTLVIEKLKQYREAGFQIVINTSRRMRTHHANEALAIADIADVTIQWLKQHNVPYDGLKFGKPYAENGFYVCDRSIRPDEFLRLGEEEIQKLLC